MKYVAKKKNTKILASPDLALARSQLKKKTPNASKLLGSLAGTVKNENGSKSVIDNEAGGAMIHFVTSNTSNERQSTNAIPIDQERIKAKTGSISNVIVETDELFFTSRKQKLCCNENAVCSCILI